MEEKKLKGLVKGAIRRLFSRSDTIKIVREKAVHPKKKGPRGGKQYICNACNACFGAGKIQVDHIKSVIGHKESVHNLDFNQIVARIFVSTRRLQVLCLACHKVKTKKERDKRTKYRRELKKKRKK